MTLLYKYPMLDQNSQKNEMEVGAENRIESESAKTAVERSVDNVLRRENPQQDQIRPART